MNGFKKSSMLVIGVLVLSIFSIYAVGEEISGSVDYSSSIIQMVVAIQDAFKNEEYGKIWRQLTKLLQQRHWGGIENFKEWYDEHPDMRKAICEAKLEKVRYITAKRALVVGISSAPGVKKLNFYLIKEDKRWKFGCIEKYVRMVKEDMELLNKAIMSYYANNGRVPSRLSQLIPQYIKAVPADIFNDAGKSYVYTGVENIVELYSFGPDGDDDLGITEYDIESVIDDGDIIREAEIK